VTKSPKLSKAKVKIDFDSMEPLRQTKAIEHGDFEQGIILDKIES